jgi:hypothetical protein
MKRKEKENKTKQNKTKNTKKTKKNNQQHHTQQIVRHRPEPKTVTELVLDPTEPLYGNRRSTIGNRKS